MARSPMKKVPPIEMVYDRDRNKIVLRYGGREIAAAQFTPTAVARLELSGPDRAALDDWVHWHTGVDLHLNNFEHPVIWRPGNRPGVLEVDGPVVSPTEGFPDQLGVMIYTTSRQQESWWLCSVGRVAATDGGLSVDEWANMILDYHLDENVLPAGPLPETGLYRCELVTPAGAVVGASERDPLTIAVDRETMGTSDLVAHDFAASAAIFSDPVEVTSVEMSYDRDRNMVVLAEGGREIAAAVFTSGPSDGLHFALPANWILNNWVEWHTGLTVDSVESWSDIWKDGERPDTLIADGPVRPPSDHHFDSLMFVTYAADRGSDRWYVCGVGWVDEFDTLMRGKQTQLTEILEDAINDQIRLRRGPQVAEMPRYRCELVDTAGTVLAHRECDPVTMPQMVAFAEDVRRVWGKRSHASAFPAPAGDPSLPAKVASSVRPVTPIVRPGNQPRLGQ